MHYGQKIIALRKAANMTQAELGEKLNVTSQAVSKWENGISEPDLETIHKMCALFNVSPNEFFGVEESQSETKTEEVPSPQPASTKIINGYCERCNKPVGPGEYKVFARKVKRGGVYDSMQELLCNDCAKKKEEQIRAENKQREDLKRAQKRKEFLRGIIWGSIAAAIMLIFAIVFTVQGEDTDVIVGGWVCVYGFFAMISQMLWDNSVNDLFFFFCKSFRMPGIIFEFSIDGFIWAICVKIFLSILSVLLSIACFVIGFFVTIFYAMVAFPFGLIGAIREMKEI